ncbi:MAG: hypothetical protein E7326_01465 [Clostridiales bacterium]|nr:hypothetical protein [Clostridiales bacterium]
MKTMTMTIPARAEWTLALRMAVSGVGAIYDLPVDVLSDLRSAVDESCELLLHQTYCVKTLTLSVEEKQDGVYMSIAAQCCDQMQTEPRADAEIAKLIIETLVRQVDLRTEDDSVQEVRMILPASVKK